VVESVAKARPKRKPAPAPEEVVESEPEPAAAPEVVAESEPEPAASESCDEVLCLVEGRGCCGKNPTAVAVAGPEEKAIDPSLPKRLTRSDIAKGLARFDGRLSTCGLKNGVVGAAPLKLKINADGSVKSVSTSAGNDAFQGCVSNLLKKANFGEAQGATSLSYPIIIR
jgi:hypothetical protein